MLNGEVPVLLTKERKGKVYGLQILRGRIKLGPPPGLFLPYQLRANFPSQPR